jgi:hypothetical protein
VRDHDVAPKFRRAMESRQATGHAGGGESLARVSHCAPDVYEPVVQLLVRGSYYLSYQATLLTLLLILFLVRLSRHHNGQVPGISMIIFGGVAGYVAGLIAFLLHPIFQENGVQQVLATLQFPAREAVIAFFWSPVRLLSWLFGAMTGALMVVISRRFGTC